MTDDELIGYCEIHCETQRALFNGTQINRMVKLAGRQDSVRTFADDEWISSHDGMHLLCALARSRLKIRLVISND